MCRPDGSGTQISESLIIDVRRQLPWRRRIASDVATASLWAAWLWLCRPVMGVFKHSPHMLTAHQTAYHPATLIMTGFPGVIERGLIAMVLVSAALWLWHKISQRGGAVETPEATPDYAAHFQMSEQVLTHCRAAQVCVVHHDAEGQIVAIRTVPTLPPTITAPDTPYDVPGCEPAPEFAEAA